MGVVLQAFQEGDLLQVPAGDVEHPDVGRAADRRERDAPIVCRHAGVGVAIHAERHALRSRRPVARRIEGDAPEVDQTRRGQPAGREVEVLPVAGPRRGDRVPVVDEERLSPGGRHDEEPVPETRAQRGVGDPASVGRPGRVVVEGVRVPAGQLLRLPAAHRNLPDAPVAVPRREERDLLAVGRPGRVGRVVDQLRGRAAQRGHQVDVASLRRHVRRGGSEVARRHQQAAVVFSRGDEGQARAVGRPGGLRVVGGVVRDARDVAPGQRKDLDVEVAGPVGRVGDVVAVGRERRLLLEPRLEGQSTDGELGSVRLDARVRRAQQPAGREEQRPHDGQHGPARP